MKFVILTDTHLSAEKSLYGLDPVARLRAAIGNINTYHADAEFVILTGDIAHRGDPDLNLPNVILIGVMNLPLVVCLI